MAELELVFSGELEPGFTADQVRANMARLFKANDAQLARMFSGRPVVLKNGLDAATAEKFRVIIARQGARVQIREAGTPSSQTSTRASAAPRLDSGSQAGLPLAGDKTEAILQGLNWSLAPPGSDLGQKPRYSASSEPVRTQDWSLAPPGSRLTQPQPPLPVPEPDTDQFSLLPLEDEHNTH